MLSHRAEGDRDFEKVSALVLAGGKARRFGGQKLFAKVGNCTLLEHVHAALLAVGFSEIIFVVSQTNEIWLESARVVVEEEQGIQHAVRTGLREAKNERIFLTAGDMPFLNPECIRWQLSKAKFSIPAWNLFQTSARKSVHGHPFQETSSPEKPLGKKGNFGGCRRQPPRGYRRGRSPSGGTVGGRRPLGGMFEPLHSVVGKNLEKMLCNGKRLAEAILDSGVTILPAEEFPAIEFFNVNTRSDLEMARTIFSHLREK